MHIPRIYVNKYSNNKLPKKKFPHIVFYIPSHTHTSLYIRIYVIVPQSNVHEA